MFSTVLKEVSGYFDRRFMISLFFPSLFFWLGLIAIYYSNSDITNLLSDWSGQGILQQAIQIVVGTAWIVFFASFLDSQLLWIFRQFEGYWNWPIAWLRRRRTSYYQEKLERETSYQNIYYGYAMSPQEPDYKKYVMPTRLGNILRNAELYPYLRYNMDAVLLWPRLYPVLPESFAKTFDATKASLDFVVIVSALSILFAFTAGGLVLAINGPIWLFLLCFLGGFLLAWLAYRSALGTAVAYGQLIKSAFDLYKANLLKQMGYKAPSSQAQEQKAWKNLRQMIYQNDWQDQEILPYLTAEEKKEEPEPPAPPLWKRLVSWISSKLKRETSPPPTDSPPPPPIPKTTPTTSPAQATPQSTSNYSSTSSARTRWLIDWQKLIVVGLIILLAGAGVLWLNANQTIQSLTVPTQNLPAYYLLSAADVTTKVVKNAEIPKDALPVSALAASRYTNQPLASGQTIQESHLLPMTNSALVSDTVPVSIPATPALAFNGQLAPGAMVTVWAITDSGQAEPLIDELLVLDVQKVDGQGETVGNLSPYVIVLAVPRPKQAEVLTAAATGSLSLTLAP